MSIVTPVVNHILEQINRQPDADRIKKLLFLKLETELSQKRCNIGDKEPPLPEDHVHILGE